MSKRKLKITKVATQEMVQLTIALPVDMKSEIIKLSELEDRTLTAQIRVLLKEALERRKENE